MKDENKTIQPIQLDSFTATLTANESQPIALSGAFIHVRSATGEFEVKTNNGDRVPMQGGDKVVFPAPFDSLVIKDLSGAGNTIELIYGAGGDYKSDSVVGTVSISGAVPVTDNGGSLTIDDGGVPLTLNKSVLSYFYVNNTSGLQTVVSPGANTAGIRIDLAAVTSEQTTRIMAKSSAPTAWNDTGAMTLALCDAAGNNSAPLSTIAAAPIIVPAGMGLYVQSNANTVNNISINYEVL